MTISEVRACFSLGRSVSCKAGNRVSCKNLSKSPSTFVSHGDGKTPSFAKKTCRSICSQRGCCLVAGISTCGEVHEDDKEDDASKTRVCFLQLSTFRQSEI